MLVVANNAVILRGDFAGYIAGSNDGIVTILNEPASRRIYLFNAETMVLAGVSTSLNNGHYIFMNLDPDLEYLVMVRDFKKEFEPFAWDFVKPATDLTPTEQRSLWLSWQTI